MQRFGLLWIMATGGGKGIASSPSLCCSSTRVTQLYRAPCVYWTYGNIAQLPVSSKAHPKVHCAISYINAGLLRDVAVLCYLFALLIWCLGLAKLEGQQVAAPSSAMRSKALADDGCLSFCGWCGSAPAELDGLKRSLRHRRALRKVVWCDNGSCILN